MGIKHPLVCVNTSSIKENCALKTLKESSPTQCLHLSAVCFGISNLKINIAFSGVLRNVD